MGADIVKCRVFGRLPSLDCATDVAALGHVVLPR